MSIVRVKDGVQCTTFDHNTGVFVALAPGLEFDSADPFVRENAWAFTTDEDLSTQPGRKGRRVTSAAITPDPTEDASSTPGTKRNR